MAFNGAGIFSRLYNWVSDKTNSIPITASRMDAEFDGFATALSQCVLKDGTQIITSNIPMNTHKFTGLSNGSARNDSIALSQVQDGQFIDLGTTGGSADAYTLTPNPSITAYVSTMEYNVKIHATNTTTTPYLQISSIANPSTTAVIKKLDASKNEIAVEVGDLLANGIYKFKRNSANDCWIILNPEKPSSILSFSGKNVLINGAMGIDQRNAGSPQTIIAGSSLAYTIDRWYAYCTGANVVGQRVAGSSPNQYNYRFTGASSVTKIGFAQRIEAINSQHLAGKTASLSVDLSNSLLTTVTWTMFYANAIDTFGSLASPSRTQISTGTFTVNSTLTRYNASISIPSNATTGIEIEFSVGSQTSGTFTIGRAQLELGGVATDFDYRNIQQEIALCQRYFEKTYNLEIALGTNTNIGARINSFQNLLGNGSNSQFYSHFLSVRKRATPSIVLYSVAGTVGKATQDDGSEINSSAGNVSELSFYTTSINTSGRYSATQHFTATSEL